ncbi:MAG: hypothetical protein H7836_01545 [Magnetococcus sp. YQC-3]
MQENIMFEDIRQNLRRYDKRGTPHQNVTLLLNLGITRQTVSKILVDEELCCRATGFNIMNGTSTKISKKLEQKLLDLLKLSLQQAIIISKNYKKLHNLKSIENLNFAILSAKKYLETLNEPMEIDFQGIGESKEIPGIDDGWIMKMIDCS